MTEILLSVKNLKKYFPVKQGFLIKRVVAEIKAVDDVSFEIKKGKTFALVGESGCGKTTVARTVLRLTDPTAGEIFFEGKEISKLRYKELLPFRRRMQIVFQDPMSSLNPRMTVGQIVTEPMLFHKVAKTKNEAYEKAKKLMEMVGLKTFHLDRYPHQFSGGQRQRIAIARAISIEPEFLILDEPTSSLDVSVQAQIINLFLDFQQQFRFSYLFISHNLGLVRFISHDVGIMYLGKIVEMGETDDVFEEPLHPYSKALLSATPIPDPEVERARQRIILRGGVPSPISRPNGCFFNPRCPFKMEICEKEYPEFRKVSQNRWVACHLVK
ncbi:ABC transporter ATP-binding protein [Pseudothermotoga sp. U03pept]|uniref:ABC transporter ATP-binding protein n=1 Tax=Pseudothermotoga sp. U03pept TaxID=3447012 RepID=UPI0030A43EDC